MEGQRSAILGMGVNLLNLDIKLMDNLLESGGEIWGVLNRLFLSISDGGSQLVELKGKI